MKWRGKTIVDVSREFLDTNGVRQLTSVIVDEPSEDVKYFDTLAPELANANSDISAAWLANLQRLNVCSQKGLAEKFDSTIGAGTILMPFGGKYQLSPAEGMAAKLPVLDGDTTTATLMSYGYNPEISKWSPFHGAVYSIVEAVTKITAMGGDYRDVRLTLQEYFEKLGKDPEKWGKPFCALLGAYYAQLMLRIPAIGGKDSMSGTFKDMTVPPTLVAFAVNVADAGKVISSEFKAAGSTVVQIKLDRDQLELPDFVQLDKNLSAIRWMAMEGKIKAAHSVRTGGIAEAVSKMCFGNHIGFRFTGEWKAEELFAPDYGSLVLELGACTEQEAEKLLIGLNHRILGVTAEEECITVNNTSIQLDEAISVWMKPLEEIFPTKADMPEGKPVNYAVSQENNTKTGDMHCNIKLGTSKPRVFIPVFPGTNCEYDSAKAFEKAGAIAEVMVIRNLDSRDIEESLINMKKRIDQSQMIMIPGGFSAGDEPDGSGKFIATAFRNPFVKEAVMEMLKVRDGLMLGVCNGFQALIKLGLVPYGEIRDMENDSPTLTFNSIGRHVSCMVRTKICSNKSPWLSNVNVGDIHTIAVSHGEGRFVANKKDMDIMIRNGQIATQYVDLDGNASYDIAFNPNGSLFAIEGITSPDGRVLGKMGHSERKGTNVAANVQGNKDQLLFEAGVAYFK